MLERAAVREPRRNAGHDVVLVYTAEIPAADLLLHTVGKRGQTHPRLPKGVQASARNPLPSYPEVRKQSHGSSEAVPRDPNEVRPGIKQGPLRGDQGLDLIERIQKAPMHRPHACWMIHWQKSKIGDPIPGIFTAPKRQHQYALS